MFYTFVLIATFMAGGIFGAFAMALMFVAKRPMGFECDCQECVRRREAQ